MTKTVVFMHVATVNEYQQVFEEVFENIIFSAESLFLLAYLA